MFNYDEITKTLIIKPKFNDELVNLPNDTEIIIFEVNEYPNHSKFNQNVDKLPQNLTHLTFGRYFNKNVDNLPPNLTHLTFGLSFNKNVDNLPPNLTHLTFGLTFNKNVDNLPPYLTHLTIGYKFNQNINNLIFIKYLSFPSISPIKNNIPIFVVNININFNKKSNCNEYITNLPPSIQK